jgi:adenylate kinase
MAKGLLVDDATMLEIIRDRVSQADAQDGFILDGFPRTQPQAEALTALMRDLGTPIDAVVLFEVGDEELVRRISGRRTCSLCNKVFNVYTAPPSSPAADCVAGSSEHQLFQRKDDEEATVKERLRVYEEKTRPVLSYYSDAGLLRTVRAEGSLEEITERLLTALADAVAPAPPAAASGASAAKGAAKKSAGRKATARKRVVRRAKPKAPARARRVVKRKKAAKTAAKRAGKPASKRGKAAAKRVRATTRSRKSTRGAKRAPRRHR